MEDSAAGDSDHDAMNEDLDYRVQTISKSVSQETDADNEELLGMIFLYYWCSSF